MTGIIVEQVFFRQVAEGKCCETVVSKPKIIKKGDQNEPSTALSTTRTTAAK
jgi:hypothetical protein